MKEDVKKLWVDALRSGDYRQGQRTLREGDRYCCLGVLCEVFQKATGKGEWRDGIFYCDNYFNSAEPPFPVREWAGLDSANPAIRDGVNKSLMRMNDALEKNFNEIADAIEEYL